MPTAGEMEPMAGMTAGTMAPTAGQDATGGTPQSVGGTQSGGEMSPAMAGTPSEGGSMATGCARDFDCPVGDRCQDGRCVPRDQMMVGGEVAMPVGGIAMPGGPCMVTSDCPGELLCDNGACVRCRLDRDCDGNQRCEAGNCEEIPPECMADNDCRADGSQRCIAGTWANALETLNVGPVLAALLATVF